MAETAKKRLGRWALRARRALFPVKTREDEFLTWLRYANAGMLDSGNVYAFDYALARLPSPAPMLEIGSFCGLSTNVMTYLKMKRGLPNKLFTCDRWRFENAAAPTVGESAILHADYGPFVKRRFIENVRFFSGADLPATIEMFSDEFFEAWRKGAEAEDVFGRPAKLGGPLSFCYIDGNHSYDYAKRDFENADAHLEAGGFILFDDSADFSGWEVCRVVAEVRRGGRYELVMKNPNYLFRKIK